MPADPATVSVRSVNKTFRIPHERYSSVKARVLHPFTARSYDALRALREVSFEVPPGECFGVVGRNGSGKSTLLRCVSGIYRPDSGAVSTVGRLAPFIELGVGFNPEMSARDNAVINAIMLGMTRKEAHDRLEEIIAFAELAEFVDLKLKNFSAGMIVRLAFAVTTHVNADVLLFDEVLAVGDSSFQRKCFRHFEALKDEGRTVLLVTHNMDEVKRFCDRAMVLEHGSVVDVGHPGVIAEKYEELNAAADGERRPAEIVDAWVEDRGGRQVTTVPGQEGGFVCLRVRLSEALEDPLFGVRLEDGGGRAVFAASSHWQQGPSGHFREGEVAEVRIGFDALPQGRYATAASVAARGGAMLHERSDLARFEVEG
jgi:ABC-type polysaccharide/polyol phosphate transport system ATPase subunit